MKKSLQIPTILIVEDIGWIRSMMREAVERQGYRVEEARNDAEAFELAESQPIDLILTEEELPTFNDLMVFLHRHPTLSSIPVVIINPDAEDGARLGDAYLLADYADIPSFLSVLTAE
jgi:two-component system chemotaxis response regulator CheY